MPENPLVVQNTPQSTSQLMDEFFPPGYIFSSREAWIQTVKDYVNQRDERFKANQAPPAPLWTW